jgi:chemotaxis protein methyltransferase CheR
MYEKYGYDFKDYARATIERRLSKVREARGFASVEQMTEQMLEDKSVFDDLARAFSINVTEMFRDPAYYKALSERVVPHLRSWPFIRVWVAGCATGEEVYSLAIMFKELGIYDKVLIYATDFNPNALVRARERIYPAREIKLYSANYLAAGGSGSLSDYYTAKHGSVIFDKALAERVIFAQHNLVTDSIFNEVQLVCCRNVMIYFNQALKNRALGLFLGSLERGGFLCIGKRENLLLTDCEKSFTEVDRDARIYKKKLR